MKRLTIIVSAFTLFVMGGSVVPAFGDTVISGTFVRAECKDVGDVCAGNNKLTIGGKRFCCYDKGDLDEHPGVCGDGNKVYYFKPDNKVYSARCDDIFGAERWKDIDTVEYEVCFDGGVLYRVGDGPVCPAGTVGKRECKRAGVMSTTDESCKKEGPENININAQTQNNNNKQVTAVAQVNAQKQKQKTGSNSNSNNNKSSSNSSSSNGSSSSSNANSSSSGNSGARPPASGTTTPATPGAPYECPAAAMALVLGLQDTYASNDAINAQIIRIFAYCGAGNSNRTSDGFSSLISQLDAMISDHDQRVQNQQAQADAAAQEAERVRQQQLRVTSVTNSIKSTFSNITSMQSGFDVSVWKTATGDFNTSRLVSDSVAGVVLGTAGGLITSNVIKKNQTKSGFEDINCAIGGQTVAGWQDEFQVGIR